MITIFWLYLPLVLRTASAQVISPSAREVEVTYQTSFLSRRNLRPEDSLGEARFHADHIFGLLQSPHLVEENSTGWPEVLGLGAPRSPWQVRVLDSRAEGSQLKIHYEFQSRLLLLKETARRWLKNEGVTLPLLANLEEVYGPQYEPNWQKCTDPLYNTPGDFWYFYDPFRKGCENLSLEPQAQPVRLSVQSLPSPASSAQLPLRELQSDNQNGRLYVIYSVHGFGEHMASKEDYALTPWDDGTKNFFEIQKHLLKKRKFINLDGKAHLLATLPSGHKIGFQGDSSRGTYDLKLETPVTYQARDLKDRFISTYVKVLKGRDGKEVTVLFRHLLVNSEHSSSRVTFAKFWREALMYADVVYYGGHSGLGDTLSFYNFNESLLRNALQNEDPLSPKADAPLRIRFDPKKTQVLFLDGCSTYSYFLDDYFRGKGIPEKTFVLTNGLSSYFETAGPVLKRFFDQLLDFQKEPTTWIAFLTDMESALKGESYLLNVGGFTAPEEKEAPSRP